MKTKYFDLKQKELLIEEDTQYVTLFVGKEGESVTSNIKFIHQKPNLLSNILIKCILFDNAKCDICGDLVIEKGSRQTDAYLKIDILLMSERASARAIPGLEITEDDVKGGHGASIGPVDSEQLYYLQSRGISETEAERLLAEGFIQDAVNKFEGEVPVEIEKELNKL